MSATLYILQSAKNGRYYIGHTNDVVRRLVEHNSGKTRSLKSWIPMELKFSQVYASKIDAVRMERKLKKWKNKEIIERIIREGVIKS